MTRPDEAFRAGLCASCLHARPLRSKGGGLLTRCGLSDSDPAYPRFPRLPVLSCPGHAVLA